MAAAPACSLLEFAFLEWTLDGYQSYRSVVWKRFPRSGMPEILKTRENFEQFVQELVDLGSIDNGKKIWWDIRPHAFLIPSSFVSAICH